MRIGHVRVFRFALPLKAGWRSAAGGFDERSGWLLCLETDEGLQGWGECAPLPGDAMPADPLLGHRELVGLDLAQAQAWLKQSHLSPAAHCALDTALADLAARQAGVPLARWLAPGADLAVACNAALGALHETTAERAREAVAEGFTLLKLKVGLAGVGRELGWLRELVGILPPGVRLRLDANRAWNEEAARHFIAGLEGWPIEMLEEPLARPDLELLGVMQRQTAIPLALDESLAELGMARVMAARAVRRLVLKPMLLGGLHASLGWARLAKEQGMECVVTTTLDSAAGTLAAAHLAAALGNGLHHGLATSSWLERDAGRAPIVRGGVISLGDVPGLDFLPDWDQLTPV